MRNPLEYGELLCKALMHKYEPEKLPPEGVLFYHQGVFLSGMQKIYRLTGKKEYFEYIKTYIDSVIGENGELSGFCHEALTKDTPELALQALQMLDHKQPTILLYDLYDETGEEKYVNAIKSVAGSMYYWPINRYGGYWHMMTQVNQMWMDGAYMIGPLSVMYADRFNDNVLRERAINQVFLMNKYMRDKKTGLYFHGWDESKQMEWADKETGLSGQFWGRADGWYAVAILDMLDYIPDDNPRKKDMEEIVKDLLDTLLNFRDEKTGMWFNVLDRIDDDKNWVETSCTSLFVYSYAKAIRKGIIKGEIYEKTIEKAYNSLIDGIYYDEQGCPVLDNVCIGTCIEEGTYEYYLSRPKVKNDLHGVGAFTLMCAELYRYFTEKRLICSE